AIGLLPGYSTIGVAAPILIGLFIRLRLTESPELNEVKEEKKVASLPFLELFKTSKKSLLIGIFCLVGSNTLFYIASVYLLSYAPDSTGLNRGEVLLAIAIGASFDVIAIPLVAIFADRHGKRTMMLVGSLVTAVAAIPIFWAMNTGTFLGAVFAMIIAFPIAHSIVYATSSGFISGLFDPEVRYTGASISYQVGGLISSAPAPMISVLLFTTFDSWVPVALYLAAANLLAGIFVLFDTRNKALSQ
ncbi:MAG: MFS transporter, partial [Brevibacterium sp.]|uniref:MFS transporter n=1 Tax=Brevibacterium sp. TaxID=1701 RepID=UPI003F932970